MISGIHMQLEHDSFYTYDFEERMEMALFLDYKDLPMEEHEIYLTKHFNSKTKVKFLCYEFEYLGKTIEEPTEEDFVKQKFIDEEGLVHSFGLIAE